MKKRWSKEQWLKFEKQILVEYSIAELPVARRNKPMFYTKSGFQFQKRFLQRMADLAPAVICELHNLLPLYQDCLQSSSKPDCVFAALCNGELELELREKESSPIQRRSYIYNLSGTPITENTSQLLDNLRKEIDQWAIKYHVNKLWIIASAFNSLHVLNTYYVKFGHLTLDSSNINNPKSQHDKWLGYLTLSVKGAEPKKKFSFLFNDWDFTKDSVAYFKEKAKAYFSLYLDEYIDEAIKDAVSKGYKKRRSESFKSIDWLVQWTVLNYSKDQILDEISIKTNKFLDKSTIDKAFRKLRTYDLPIREE